MLLQSSECLLQIVMGVVIYSLFQMIKTSVFSTRLMLPCMRTSHQFTMDGSRASLQENIGLLYGDPCFQKQFMNS